MWDLLGHSTWRVKQTWILCLLNAAQDTGQLNEDNMILNKIYNKLCSHIFIFSNSSFTNQWNSSGISKLFRKSVLQPQSNSTVNHLTHCLLQIPRLHGSSHRLRSEPIKRLKNISKVLFKEPHHEGVRFMRWGNRVQIEKHPKELFPWCLLLLWLICVWEADEVEFPCLLHYIPTLSRSECSSLRYTGIFSETGPQESCSLCLATQFPETSLNVILMSCGPTSLNYGRFIPPEEIGVTDVEEMVLGISSYPTITCQTLKVMNGWVFTFWPLLGVMNP